jgi:phosphoglycerol transferase MdoB-like AlkP superfamily enzyme
LLSATPLPEIFNLLHLTDQFDLHRQRINYAFNEITNRPQVEQPVFTFAHILAPHPPFVFDAHGEPLADQGLFIMKDGNQYFGSKDDYIHGYRDQLHFISYRIGQVIQEILDQSQRPVIIIIQGDHGPGSGLNQGSWEKSDIPERLSILNAYYFPNQDYRQLYPQISPVNSFRVIMNQYLGTSYDLLEDRSYYVSLYEPYIFVDVTDQLR